MLFRDIIKILSHYLFGFSISLLLPLGIACYYEFFQEASLHPQPHSAWAFLMTFIISLSLAGLCYFVSRGSKGTLYIREGFVVVCAIWLITPTIAALPFYLSGTLNNPVQAFFEATSGFTTTGASTMQAKRYTLNTEEEIPIQVNIQGAHSTRYRYFGTIEPVRNKETRQIELEGIEAVSKALLFWRSMTQWLGGMGVVVLFVAILPVLGIGAKQLFQTEMPGPLKESLTPRIKETAAQLWKIYLGLSLLEVLALKYIKPDLSLFDTVVTTFSTVSTGGFTVTNFSIGSYNSIGVEWVVMLFMVLGSINYGLYFSAMQGKFYRLYQPELFLFIAIILLCGGLASTALYNFTSFYLKTGVYTTYTTAEAIRYGFFMIISSLTTTGFVVTPYDLWPYSVLALMLIVMYIGGMSGSTAGGMKIMRLYLIFQISKQKIESYFRPEAVRTLKVGKVEINERASSMVLCFFTTLIATAVFSTYIFIEMGLDPETALSLVTLLVNNIGIGFRMASPSESMAFLSNTELIFSCFLMILGRLEFFAVLTILIPAFWRQES